ncbi:hypothetical protein LEP1GSC170_0271, partial [Leptospira interrogans serovar Bataviae str. HAI135]
MFNANSQGITDVAALTNGAATIKDPLSKFKKIVFKRILKDSLKK